MDILKRTILQTRQATNAPLVTPLDQTASLTNILANVQVKRIVLAPSAVDTPLALGKVSFFHAVSVPTNNGTGPVKKFSLGFALLTPLFRGVVEAGIMGVNAYTESFDGTLYLTGNGADTAEVDVYWAGVTTP